MLKLTSLQAAFGLAQLLEDEILRKNLSHVCRELVEEESQKIVEVLEDQKEQVPQPGDLVATSNCANAPPVDLAILTRPVNPTRIYRFSI